MTRRENSAMGIIDATPIAQLIPIAQTHDSGAAISDARAVLEAFGVSQSNREMLTTTAVLRRL